MLKFGSSAFDIYRVNLSTSVCSWKFVDIMLTKHDFLASYHMQFSRNCAPRWQYTQYNVYHTSALGLLYLMGLVFRVCELERSLDIYI